MRLLATLLSVLALCGVQAQRPNIATLLSLADCLDTTCVSERLRPMDYCPYGGKEKDGWMWYRCGPLDPLLDHERMVTLGFFGYAISNYRDYIIGTGDTMVADTLTEELRRLGFTVASPHPEGQIFRNSAYPSLEVYRLEKRSGSIEFKKKEDPIDPRAEPIDPHGCGDSETLKQAKEMGYDRVELIPKLYWVFKVHVPTPHLMISSGEMKGTFNLYYPVYGAVKEFVVRDLSGKEVLRSMTEGMRTEFDLLDQPSGLYFLTIRTAASNISKTFRKD